MSPGKLVRNPLVSAASRVDKAGENREAWAKATSSAGVADPMAEFACSVGAFVSLGKKDGVISEVLLVVGA